MIRQPRLGRLTQGTIFCGALAEDYKNDPVWGLVITARCDTAHDKTPILNYLPVVRVEDWLKRHGGLIVANRATTDVIVRFTALLSQRGLSASLLEVHGAAEIVSVHFESPASLVGKEGLRLSKEIARARECAAQLDKLGSLLSSTKTTIQDMSDLLRSHRKLVQSLLNELLGHRVAGYYFLPDIGTLTEQGSNLGYVVLLREVHHLSRELAAKLVDGVSSKSPGSDNQNTGLCFEVFDFACPVAEVHSPWVEHLMQAFCNLFGRIGIADYDRERVTSIVNAVAPEQEVAV